MYPLTPTLSPSTGRGSKNIASLSDARLTLPQSPFLSADDDRVSTIEPIALAEPAASVATTGAERRRSVREARQVNAWLSEPKNGSRAAAQQQVVVNDLSLHGVGFRSERKLERHAAHWIVIASETLHLSTRLKVVSVRERAEGGYDVGAEFF